NGPAWQFSATEFRSKFGKNDATPKRGPSAFASSGFRQLDLFGISRFGFRIWVWHLYQLRLNDETGPDLLQAVDDHALARLQPLGDFPEPVVESPQPDWARHHFVLLIHDVEDLLALVGVKRAVGDQEAFVRRANRDADSGEIAGGKRLILVWK